MIELELNGVPYTDFVSASITVSLPTLANSFSFVASSKGGFPPFAIGDRVRASADGIAILSGYVEVVAGSDDENHHTITYSGRDKTFPLIDSSFDAIGEIDAAGITLQKLAEITVAHIGADIRVLDMSDSQQPFNVAEDVIAPAVGESALRFLSDWAAKRSAILTSNGDGDVVIASNAPASSGATLQRLVNGGANNNILSQSWSLDWSKVARLYAHRSVLDLLAVNQAGDVPTDQVVNQSGEYLDSQGAPGKQFVVAESKSYSNEQLAQRAKWASQLARAKATKYRCVVRGHQNNADQLWAVNTLVAINSETASLNKQMLLEEVVFSEGEQQQTQSALRFVEPGVYSVAGALLAQQPADEDFDAYT